MQIQKFISRTRRLDYLIRRKSTGSPAQLANRLGVSEATIYRYIQELKDMGAPIKYCRERQSYKYEKDYELEF
jgi:predicted DNA-binding transcriptional regulator YafY